MSEKKRKSCQICGRPYVPTSNVQKYCPDCRKQMQKDGNIKDAYLAYKKAQAPGPVRVSQIQTPEDGLMDIIETPETVIIPEGIPEGYKMLQKAIDMPEGLAVIEEHAEILRRYYKGELVDKEELLARIRERLGEF